MAPLSATQPRHCDALNLSISTAVEPAIRLGYTVRNCALPW